MTPGPPFARGRARPRRGLRVGVVVVILVLLVLGVAGHISLNYYVLSPGDAQAVGPLITVPPAHAHRLHGSILLTDVLVRQETLLSYVPDHLSSNNEILPTNALTGSSSIPDSELAAQGYLEMVQAKAAAKTAALRSLGYSVPEHDAGAVVEAVSTGTPAYGVVSVGQVITALDGTPTSKVCAFVRALNEHQPGQSVTLTVRANRFSASGSLVVGPLVQRRVRLVGRPASLAGGQTCPDVASGRAFLGVALATQQDFTFPFPITMNTANIGGPSAGLALTLGLLNTLSGGDLTAGRTIAATGTIDPTGVVGDVGGVPQKTIAVEQAGATVFFVPGPELQAARSKASPRLRVYAVNTLSQVLSVLRKLGGKVPAATAKG